MRNKFLVFCALILVLVSCFTTKQQAVSKNAKEELKNCYLIQTELGNIKIRLYEQTPLHKANFEKLVTEKYYDSTLFHRIIKDFMIQGGDPDSKNAPQGKALGMGGPNYTIPAEFVDSLVHKKGALAAARQGDYVNPQKRSSGSQFYIVQGRPILVNSEKYSEKIKQSYALNGGTPQLDGSYTVFGEVVEGLNILDSIAAVQTDSKDRPLKDIKMTIKKL